MPGDREVCEMISNAEWLKTMLESLRHMVQHTVSEGNSASGGASAGGASSGGASRQKPANMDEMDMPMYNEPGTKPYGMEVKKRRGVRFPQPPKPYDELQTAITNMFYRELHHLDGATAATVSIRPSGAVDLTVPVHSVTHAVFITPSSSARSNWRVAKSGPSILTTVAKPTHDDIKR